MLCSLCRFDYHTKFQAQLQDWVISSLRHTASFRRWLGLQIWTYQLSFETCALKLYMKNHKGTIKQKHFQDVVAFRETYVSHFRVRLKEENTGDGIHSTMIINSGSTLQRQSPVRSTPLWNPVCLFKLHNETRRNRPYPRHHRHC